MVLHNRLDVFEACRCSRPPMGNRSNGTHPADPVDLNCVAVCNRTHTDSTKCGMIRYRNETFKRPSSRYPPFLKKKKKNNYSPTKSTTGIYPHRHKQVQHQLTSLSRIWPATEYNETAVIPTPTALPACKTQKTGTQTARY